MKQEGSVLQESVTVSSCLLLENKFLFEVLHGTPTSRRMLP